jgi:hypothetical protein
MEQPATPAQITTLRDWARKVDRLHERYFLSARPPQPGSRLATEDVDLWPYRLSYEASMRLSVAADFLHGVRCLTVDDQYEGVQLHTFSPFPLLRAALEGACTVAWLIDPHVDAITRARRRIELLVGSHAARDRVQGAMNVPKQGWERDEDWLQRVTTMGIDARAMVKNPRQLTSNTEIVAAGAALLSAAKPKNPTGEAFLVGWRALSGLTHADLWAVMSVPAKAIESGSDPETDEVRATFYSTPETLILWTWLATLAVEQAGSWYDLQRLAFRDHA